MGAAGARAQENRLPDIGSSAGSVLGPAQQAEYGRMLLAQLRHYLQAPARAAWLAAWLLALFPLLPMTAVTLWKDVPMLQP